MSQQHTDRSLRARVDRVLSSLRDADRGSRRKLAVFIFFLLIFLISTLLYGPGLLDRSRHASPLDTTQQPVDSQADAEPAPPDAPSIDTNNDAPVRSVCGDGVCDSAESCPADCPELQEIGGERTQDTNAEPSSLLSDPCSLADCPDSDDGAEKDVRYCALFCTTDADCGEESAEPGAQLACTDHNCWEYVTCNDLGDVEVSAGNCGSPCVTGANCNGLTCLNGTCWNETLCNPLPRNPESLDAQETPGPDPCRDHGGLQWTGNVCVCAGVVDQVTICQDGHKIDRVTEMACLPDQNTCGSSAGVQDELGFVPGGDAATPCPPPAPDEGKAC